MNQPQQASPTAFQPLATNRKAVNLVAMGSSRSDFTSLQMTEQRPGILMDAELWVINYLGAAWRCDRIIHVDPVHPFLGTQVVRDMCDFAAKDGIPLYTSWPHPLYPNHRLYPFDLVCKTLGAAYINTSVSAAIALALYEGFNEINLFGCDFSYPNAHLSESGRACCEFWLGIASQRGVRIGMAATTTLLDTHCGQHPYGWFADPMAPPVNGGRLMTMDEIFRHCEQWRTNKMPRADFYRFDTTRPGVVQPLVPGATPHPDLLSGEHVVSAPGFGLNAGVYGELNRAANLSMVAIQNHQAAQAAGVSVRPEFPVPVIPLAPKRRKKMNGAAPPPHGASTGDAGASGSDQLPRAE